MSGEDGGNEAELQEAARGGLAVGDHPACTVYVRGVPPCNESPECVSALFSPFGAVKRVSFATPAVLHHSRPGFCADAYVVFHSEALALAAAASSGALWADGQRLTVWLMRPPARAAAATAARPPPAPATPKPAHRAAAAPAPAPAPAAAPAPPPAAAAPAPPPTPPQPPPPPPAPPAAPARDAAMAAAAAAAAAHTARQLAALGEECSALRAALGATASAADAHICSLRDALAAASARADAQDERLEAQAREVSRAAADAASAMAEVDRVRLCPVCMDAAKDSVLLPCRHHCACAHCAIAIVAQQNALCPICRRPVNSWAQIFV